jgi:hypothetical protein
MIHLNCTASRESHVVIKIEFPINHDGPVRYAVAPQLIGYQPPGFASLAFQQPMKEAFGCTLIATGLDKNIDYVPA